MRADERENKQTVRLIQLGWRPGQTVLLYVSHLSLPTFSDAALSHLAEREFNLSQPSVHLQKSIYLGLLRRLLTRR